MCIKAWMRSLRSWTPMWRLGAQATGILRCGDELYETSASWRICIIGYLQTVKFFKEEAHLIRSRFHFQHFLLKSSVEPINFFSCCHRMKRELKFDHLILFSVKFLYLLVFWGDFDFFLFIFGRCSRLCRSETLRLMIAHAQLHSGAGKVKCNVATFLYPDGALVQEW